MSASGSVAAIDLGATSGRVIVGHINHDSIRMEHVARFPNGPMPLWEGSREALHWDVPWLFTAALDGLREAVRGTPDLASIGVDSWAVDYGLLRDGRLLGLPSHYRDDRHTAGVGPVHAAVGPAELYRRNGLQHLPFNTVFQFAADPDLQHADRALLVPDLLGYWLTGVPAAERTNASTTGMLNATTRQWDPTLVAAGGAAGGRAGSATGGRAGGAASGATTGRACGGGLLPALRDPGDGLGVLLPTVRDAVGARDGLGVTLVGSHDTASAVVAVPATEPDFAYISSGTWSLVGVELDRPVLTAAAREANCTNEGGVDGRVRFLKNVSGMWVLSESIRTWHAKGIAADLEALLASAAHVDTGVGVFDITDDRFTPPGNMPARIDAWCAEHAVRAPVTPAEYVRSILESLAAAYASTLQAISVVSGAAPRVVHVVGGGSQNALLCQLTSDRTGLPVVAGPVEATALGNVLVQARAAGVAGLAGASLESLRARVAQTSALIRYTPQRIHV